MKKRKRGINRGSGGGRKEKVQSEENHEVFVCTGLFTENISAGVTKGLEEKMPHTPQEMRKREK